MFSKQGQTYGKGQADVDDGYAELSYDLEQKGSFCSPKINPVALSFGTGLYLNADVATNEIIISLTVPSILQLENIYAAYPSWKLFNQSDIGGNDYALVCLKSYCSLFIIIVYYYYFFFFS